LQGFPENFIIPVSDNQAYKQFGNSVAVNVIKELARSIINTLPQVYNNSIKQLKPVDTNLIKENAILKAQIL
jgi:DNA (cytosine-5)-methyltransferase 1